MAAGKDGLALVWGTGFWIDPFLHFALLNPWSQLVLGAAGEVNARIYFRSSEECDEFHQSKS